MSLSISWQSLFGSCGAACRMQEIGRESLDKPMGSVAQIAALVSQEGIFSAPNTYSTLTSCAIEKPRIFELPYLGAPIDHYELHDVLKNELDRHPASSSGIHLFCPHRADGAGRTAWIDAG